MQSFTSYVQSRREDPDKVHVSTAHRCSQNAETAGCTTTGALKRSAPLLFRRGTSRAIDSKVSVDTREPQVTDPYTLYNSQPSLLTILYVSDLPSLP